MINDAEFDRLIAAALLPVEREPDEAFVWSVRMTVVQKALAQADRSTCVQVAGRAAAAFALIVTAAMVANTNAALNALSSLHNPALLAMTCLACFWLAIAMPTSEGDLT